MQRHGNARGVEFGAVDRRRQTACQVAAERGFDDVVQLIQYAEARKLRRNEAASAEQA